MGGVFAALFVGSEIIKALKSGKVKYSKTWSPVDDKTIVIYGGENEDPIKMTLPKDPDTGKQLKVSDIAAVGTTQEGGPLHVEIKHKATDRHGFYNGGDYSGTGGK